jgi:hypothetical protein
MEQHMEALLVARPFGGIRDILSTAGGTQPGGSSGPVFRQHDPSCARLSRRRKRGQKNQAFDRSRGGFSTKFHLKTDVDGSPLDFHLTGGEVSDITLFETSLAHLIHSSAF